MEIKTKTTKWDLIKSFCTTKKTINKGKTQPSKWERVITKETTYKYISFQNIQAPIPEKQTTQSKSGKDQNCNEISPHTGQNQFSPVAQLCLTLCPQGPQNARLACPTQTHVHQISDAIQPPHLLFPPPPAFSLTSIRVFSSESALRIRWPNYWSFNFNISLSNEHSGLISFRIGWLDLFAIQGTLKSLLQHHSSKASSLPCSAFFIVQLSYP